MSEEKSDSKLKLRLCEIRGSTSIFIDAEILKNGILQLSGQDVGEAPRKMFGDSDYEYWLTVPANQKDKLLLALLEALYHDDASVVSKLKEVLEAKSIPHEFSNYM